MTDNEDEKAKKKEIALEFLTNFLDENGDTVILTLLSDDPSATIKQEMIKVENGFFFMMVVYLAAQSLLARAPTGVMKWSLALFMENDPYTQRANIIYEARSFLCKNKFCFKDAAEELYIVIPTYCKLYTSWGSESEDYKARVKSGEFKEDAEQIAKAYDYYNKRT